MKVLWNNIYHFRRKKWLTQKDLAKLAETTQSIISNTEKWNYNIGLNNLWKISDALDESISVLSSERPYFEKLCNLKKNDFFTILFYMWNPSHIDLIKEDILEMIFDYYF